MGENGGIIGPENLPTTSAASGVWSLAEAYDADIAGTWPDASPFPIDFLVVAGGAGGAGPSQDRAYRNGRGRKFWRKLSIGQTI